jgi:hypothetical protein
MLRLCTIYSIQHWLYLEFCFEFFKTLKYKFEIRENKELHVAQESWGPAA